MRVARDVRGVAATNGLGGVLASSVTTVVAGAVTVWVLEPTIESLPDALWWAVVTSTTVGYGDLAPARGGVRVLAVVLMLVGIGTIGMLTGSIATYFLRDDGMIDPEIEQVRNRLVAWAELTSEERRRPVAILATWSDDDPEWVAGA
jgi:voltage-gated potassium channel